jgi:predicted aspartyl protease
MAELPLEIINLNNDGFHLLVEAVIFGQIFKLVVDTGASRTVLDRTTVETFISPETLVLSDQLSAGLGTDSMESHTLLIPELKLGSLTIRDFESAVLDLSIINQAYASAELDPVIGVLGGDILVSHSAIIDYGRKKISLT